MAEVDVAQSTALCAAELGLVRPQLLDTTASSSSTSSRPRRASTATATTTTTVSNHSISGGGGGGNNDRDNYDNCGDCDDDDDDLVLQLEECRHLLVEDYCFSRGVSAFMPNDLRMSRRGRDNCWFITGPNMGGKSTFLRSVAHAVCLAQAGVFVPARSARVGVVDQLFSRVGASDDLGRGKSTFLVEMEETALILNRAGPRSLVIVDEIGGCVAYLCVVAGGRTWW
jgi:hypothetical protein